MKSILITISLFTFAFSSEFYYEYGKKVILKELPEQRVLNGKDTRYFINEKGHKVGVSNEIIVKCISSVNCSEKLKELNFTDISNLTSTLYLVKVDNSDEIFTIAQSLYQNENIEFAIPNFLKKRERR